METQDPVGCKICDSETNLLECFQCKVHMCGTHIRSHMTTNSHFGILVLSHSSLVPLHCYLCARNDVRSLVFSQVEDGDVFVLCRKGCKITIQNFRYPTLDARSVIDGDGINDWCFEKEIRGVKAVPVTYLLEEEKKKEVVLPIVQNRTDSTVTNQDIVPESESTRAPPKSREKRPKPKESDPIIPSTPQLVDTRPQSTPTKLPPASLLEDAKCDSPVRPQPEEHKTLAETYGVFSSTEDTEELITQSVVPDVFEDEDEYMNVFTDILGLEVLEERKQMSHIRTETIDVRWYKEGKIAGETTLESVEELSPGDDLRVTDSYGHEAIITVSEIDSENTWINFKGNLQNLNVQYLDPDFPDANQPSGERYIFEFWESGSIKRMKEGLRTFHRGRTVDQQVANWILGLEKPCLNEHKQEILRPEGVRLNRFQEEAIQHALANEIALIQGPPGTGKTATAAAVVYNIYKKVFEQVLVCAPSNIAADQLTLTLANFLDLKVLRIYGKSRIKQGGFLPAEEHSLHMKVRVYLKEKYPDTGDAFLDKLQPIEKILAHFKVAEDLEAIEQEIIEEHHVICCTCAGSTSKKISSRKFKYLLVDEAGFSAEPECLLPILKGCEHIVLVGDHMQLPPVVKSRTALKRRYGRSMFERLIDIGIEAKMLQLQYRMHPALSAFPSREFYNGKLRDGIEARDRVIPTLNSFWNSSTPMTFYDINGSEQKYGQSHSYCNPTEAELVEWLLYELLQNEIPPASIGIITPYDGQRRYLSEYIENMGRCDIENVEIKNIDGFQGREKDLIIISCVRSNADAEIGFLTEARRLNVAITRARYGLVMVGNINVLRSGKFWRGLIGEFSQNRCIRDGDTTLQELRLG